MDIQKINGHVVDEPLVFVLGKFAYVEQGALQRATNGIVRLNDIGHLTYVKRHFVPERPEQAETDRGPAYIVPYVFEARPNDIKRLSAQVIKTRGLTQAVIFNGESFPDIEELLAQTKPQSS